MKQNFFIWCIRQMLVTTTFILKSFLLSLEYFNRQTGVNTTEKDAFKSVRYCLTCWRSKQHRIQSFNV